MSENGHVKFVDAAQRDMAGCCWPKGHDVGPDELRAWEPCSQHAEFGNLFKREWLAGRISFGADQVRA